jgi:hypothetical protein
MKQGIYEQLINTITRQEISALDLDREQTEDKMAVLEQI